MSSELLACIVIALVIGIFLLWRIPIGRRIKREEQRFIEENKDNYAILIFYGDELEFEELDLNSMAKIGSYYGKETYAIPCGKYNSIAIFPFNYRDPNSGSGRSNIGYTGRVYQELSMSKGNVYRYRIKEQTAVSRKVLYETLIEKSVVSRPLSHLRLEYTVVFEQIIS